MVKAGVLFQYHFLPKMQLDIYIVIEHVQIKLKRWQLFPITEMNSSPIYFSCTICATDIPGIKQCTIQLIIYSPISISLTPSVLAFSWEYARM